MLLYKEIKCMKVNKTQGVLFIFNMLIEQRSISKREVMSVLEISDITFKRYMQELRAYIDNFGKDYQLVYTRSEDQYYLKK